MLARDTINSTTRKFNGITLDFGRQHFNEKVLGELLAFAEEKKILESFRAMCSGAVVNKTENRQALHTALRDPGEDGLYAKEIHETLDRVCDFADQIRNGTWTGASGEVITEVLNVGIGGSDLGPKVVYEALRPVNPKINAYFLSAADPVLFERVVSQLDPNRTVVVISSKSFKTIETKVNAEAVIAWLNRAGIVGNGLKHHVVTVSANSKAHEVCGLPKENHYPIWEWVGGRFSVWSAIGLPVAISLGSDVFRELLQGAHEMDVHARTENVECNIPALLALFEYYNCHIKQSPNFFLLSYDERLRRVPEWLQQLEMESLGKAKKVDGTLFVGRGCPAVHGGHGNEGQHSYYQWVREGSWSSSIDMCFVDDNREVGGLKKLLKMNFESQVEALSKKETDSAVNSISTLVLSGFGPRQFGALLSMYEHKTSYLGFMLGINVFDQPGVELGKKIVLDRLE